MDNDSKTGAAAPTQGVSALGVEFLRLQLEAELNKILEDEMEDFIERAVGDLEPVKNGHYERTVMTSFGPVRVKMPRDRLALFKSRILGRYARRLPDLDQEVISLYKAGLSAS